MVRICLHHPLSQQNGDQTFRDLCLSTFLKFTSGIIWWDKRFTAQDIFETKITSSSLRLCFPNYYGNNTYKEGSEFIQKQFLQLRRNSKTKIWLKYKLKIKYFLDDRKTTYSHFTCGTDTENIRQTVQNNKVNLINYFYKNSR